MVSYFSHPNIDVAANTGDGETSPELQQLIDPLGTGFQWYLPPMATARYDHPAAAGHEWKIAGDDMQVLTVSMEPRETLVTEVGSFMMGSSGIELDVECTCRTKEGCRRICGGESCVKLLLTNQSGTNGVCLSLLYCVCSLTPNCTTLGVSVCWFNTHLPGQDHPDRVWKACRIQPLFDRPGWILYVASWQCCCFM